MLIKYLKILALAIFVVSMLIVGCVSDNNQDINDDSGEIINDETTNDQVEEQVEDQGEEQGETQTIESVVEPVEASDVELRVTGSDLAIRKEPGITELPKDVLTRVDYGKVLILLSNHDDTMNYDGYTWWEVQDPVSGVKGWSAKDYLVPEEKFEINERTDNGLIAEEKAIDSAVEIGKESNNGQNLNYQTIQILSMFNGYRNQSYVWLDMFRQAVQKHPPSNPNNYIILDSYKETLKGILIDYVNQMNQLNDTIRQFDFAVWQDNWVNAFIDYSLQTVYLKIDYMELTVKGCYSGEQFYFDEAALYLSSLAKSQKILNDEWNQLLNRHNDVIQEGEKQQEEITERFFEDYPPQEDDTLRHMTIDELDDYAKEQLEKYE